MRRACFIFSILACCMLGADVNAAPARGSARGGATATSGRGASAPVSSARAATTGATKAVSARSATAPKKNTVAARAATTQKVVNTGTKVAAATANGTVSDACKNLYYGCMDSFCMLDNTSGGRCLCSDRNAELDLIANEIQKLDEQTYAMATSGVERIEMGEIADDVIKQAKDVANSFTNTGSETVKKRQKLDLTMWSSAIDFSEDEEEAEASFLDGKSGAGLHDAVYDLCSAQIANQNPECNASLSMLKLMYTQQIKSDCTAYENSLKQQKTASTQKLMAAETALRDAALEQYKSANKYDLGQCTIEFKKCMMTTAECGDDFSKCASMVALDNTNSSVKSSKKQNTTYSIKGAKTAIEISASTYDTLIAKKPICDSVTKSCVKVRDKVWDTFLAEVAPQLKSAELIAEDNARQNCTASISSCFQKACKDNIDPNDPDGSYDMCLTRPETMISLCKVPLNACGISTEKKEYEKSLIWQYVKAVMASMRVDSCTNEVKECLQADTRCGQDYTQCIGLDLDSIKQMCPPEKLVGCQKDGNLASFDDDALNNLLQGVYLSLDNAMLDQCQKIVDEKMIEVCGDTGSCNAFDEDEYLGTEGLRISKNNNDFVISGLVSFGNVTVSKTQSTDDNVKFGQYEIILNNYFEKIESNKTGDNANSIKLSKASLETVSSKINQVIAMLSQDAKVQMCVNGRDMSQIRGKAAGTSVARFPYLLDSSMLTIINSGLDKARANHTKKFNELVASATEEQNDQVKQVLCAAMASSDDPIDTNCDNNGVCKLVPSTTYLDNLFPNNNLSNEPYAVQYIIPGADLTSLVKVSANASKEFIMTDGWGNMIGNTQMSAVYSAKDNTCSITTTTMMCKNADAVITTSKSSKCNQGGFNLFGGGSCGSHGGVLGIGGGSEKIITTQHYEGTVCKEFQPPMVSTEKIKM